MNKIKIFIVKLLVILLISSTAAAAALKEGESGMEVTELQRLLIAKGLLDGKADGIYGGATTAAIKKFQAVAGLQIDGICGDETYRMLMQGENSTTNDDGNYAIKYGMQGADVEELQNILIALGYMSGAADGYAGGGTIEAIKKFQSSHGLTADGICGADAINIEAEAYMSGNPIEKNIESNNFDEKNAVIGAVIKEGMHGEGVKYLQEKLIERGYLSGEADGICGAGTVAAIKKFQASVGLNADGIAGVATLSRLNETEIFNANENEMPTELINGGYAVIKGGMHGEGVKYLQEKLIEHGYLSGHADGIAGERTVSAIKRFQSSAGLKADGVCGLQTYAALEDADYNISDTSWADEVDELPTLGRSVYVEATAYSPFEGGNRTARGNIVRRGIIAVDPRFIPLGTRVYIPGYGEAVADDTGGAILGNRIDIAFDTYDEAMHFGRQHIEIYILDN